MPVTFRPVRADDHPFLRALYASTRQDEMALSGWAPEQVEAFLTMQFELQHAHYQRHYADADFLVVGTPTWMGHMSSVAQRVLERLDAELSETDAEGRPILFG